MSRHRGPNIVSDQLVFNFDISSYKSYTSGSSLITNLAGPHHGTIEGTMGYDPNNGGSLDMLPGNDTRIKFDQNNDPNNLTRLSNQMTWESINYPRSVGGKTFFSRGAQGNLGFYWIMYFQNRLYFQYRKSGNIGYTYRFSTYYPDPNKWYYIQIVLDAPNLYYYFNGELKDTFTDLTDLGLADFDDDLYVGSYTSWTNSWEFDGLIAQSRIYKKALSYNEVRSNYISMKSKFII